MIVNSLNLIAYTNLTSNSTYIYEQLTCARIHFEALGFRARLPVTYLFSWLRSMSVTHLHLTVVPQPFLYISLAARIVLVTLSGEVVSLEVTQLFKSSAICFLNKSSVSIYKLLPFVGT